MTLTWPIIGIVLFAAMLHASWNALIKSGTDKAADTSLVCVGGAIVARDDEVEETGLGAGVLNDPVAGIVWLTERLALYGQTIEAGQVVLAGSFIRPIECPPGSKIAADFGPRGVRVNAISPGEIDTAILSPGTENLVSQIPMRRLGAPSEVAKAIYFLCTEQSSYVNGAELLINGGQHV